MSPSLEVVSSATRLDFGLNPRGAGSIFGLNTLLGGSGAGSAAIRKMIKINYFVSLTKEFF